MTAVTDEQVIRDRLDVEMLERPHLWPARRHGARCIFLKQRDRTHTGPCFLTTDLMRRGGPRYTVIDFDWTKDDPKPMVRQYDSAEDVLAAGWVVD